MPHFDPTADAFMRRILQNPADPLPRLVFADWLDETGTSSNMAWARYLRLADEIANAQGEEGRRAKLAGSLDRIAGCIQAKLRFRAETLVANPDAILQLLPARNLTVSIEMLVLPQITLECMPESLARENRILPIALLQDGAFLIAACEPAEWGLMDRMQFIFNRNIVLVGAYERGLEACLDRNYGNLDTESIESVHYRWLPNDGVQTGSRERSNDPAIQFLDLIVLEALENGASALELETDATRITVWQWFSGLRRQAEYLPSSDVVASLVYLIRAHTRNLVLNPDNTTSGDITVSYWNRVRTFQVRFADHGNGQNIVMTIPPEVPPPLAVALNPAA